MGIDLFFTFPPFFCLPPQGLELQGRHSKGRSRAGPIQSQWPGCVSHPRQPGRGKWQVAGGSGGAGAEAGLRQATGQGGLRPG